MHVFFSEDCVFSLGKSPHRLFRAFPFDVFLFSYLLVPPAHVIHNFFLCLTCIFDTATGNFTVRVFFVSLCLCSKLLFFLRVLTCIVTSAVVQDVFNYGFPFPCFDVYICDKCNFSKMCSAC